jgi:hypothetical protein
MAWFYVNSIHVEVFFSVEVWSLQLPETKYMSEEYKEKKLNEGVELPLFAYTDPKKRNDDILDDLISYIVYNLWM